MFFQKFSKDKIIKIVAETLPHILQFPDRNIGAQILNLSPKLLSLR